MCVAFAQLQKPKQGTQEQTNTTTETFGYAFQHMQIPKPDGKAIHHKNLKLAAELIDVAPDGKAIYNAIRAKNLKLAANLIDVTPKLALDYKDELNNTLVHYAALDDELVTIVQKLIDKGAKFDTQNKSGFTPLSTAAGQGCIKVLELLISRKADVNTVAQQGGLTPLESATSNGHVKATELLLDAGAHFSLNKLKYIDPKTDEIHQPGYASFGRLTPEIQILLLTRKTQTYMPPSHFGPHVTSFITQMVTTDSSSKQKVSVGNPPVGSAAASTANNSAAESGSGGSSVVHSTIKNK